jgi:hypothetical protein
MKTCPRPQRNTVYITNQTKPCVPLLLFRDIRSRRASQAATGTSRFARNNVEQQAVASSEQCRVRGGTSKYTPKIIIICAVLTGELRSGPLQARSAGTPGNSFQGKQFITRTAQGSNGLELCRNKVSKKMTLERSSIISKEGLRNPGSKFVRAKLTIFHWIPFFEGMTQ